MSSPSELLNLPSPPWHGPATERVVQLLTTGSLTLHGLLPWSSNFTFLGEVSDDEARALVVYKPSRGERPLSDFPTGTLAKRETAAYVLSRELSWDLVPDGCASTTRSGSVQLFVDADQEAFLCTARRSNLPVCPSGACAI
jgi:uncharacterized repeat protein (TIGR03843 family)